MAKQQHTGLTIQVTVSSPNTLIHKPFISAKEACEFLLKHCTPEERITLFGDYCKYCGTDSLPCHCENDD